MPDESEGLRIARGRIAREKEERSGFLDLGRLGLQRWPEELWELEHLTGLNLGNGWHENGEWRNAESSFASNCLKSGKTYWPCLTHLGSLHINGMEWADLNRVSGLVSLRLLDCSFGMLTTLEGLKECASLQALNCRRNHLTTLAALEGLRSLRSVDCYNNRLTTLEGLEGCVSLRSLDCRSNRLATLKGLEECILLRSLQCSRNQITTLEPLRKLASLQTLHCSHNSLSTLEPLAELGLIQELDFYKNHITALNPLARLTSLQSLDCRSNPIQNLPEALVRHPLRELILFNTRIQAVPAEILSRHETENCLERLRAHFRDLAFGEVMLPDVKVMVLGNGRTGKTQLCNRLRGLPFEENADSTHGITVASQEFGADTLLRLWDFGGQDIYHGTHALFMRSRAVFLLVWTPDSENSKTHEHAGMTFRNRPLAWWLSYVRHLAGPETPVLLVQNRCDRPEDRRLRPPVAPEDLEDFPFHQVLHYSALNQRGKRALEEALEEAVGWLREKQGQASIGTGRLAVKNMLEALPTEDASMADSSQRRHRTLSMERYEEICAECGGVSSPALLLEYLHLCGIVLHKPGLFGDGIILDQGWTLEAVYSVFNRDRCFRQLRQLDGRMTRTLLEALVWQDYTEKEQKLFLGFMLSCGICFIHRKGNEELGFETEYIAPDLLPDYASVARRVESRWKEEPPFNEAVIELPFAHPGVMRALLSRIGNGAGMSPDYWRDGVCLYESIRRSHARIEQRLEAEPPVIVIRTREDESLSLLRELAQWVRDATVESGLREIRMRLPESSNFISQAGAQSTIPDRQSSSSLIFNAMPNTGPPTYAVSYAWKDQSKETVERLCREAGTRGIRILRDVNGVGLGESLSKFMTSLAGQDRVFVILSDAYLRSENCMFELSEIWRLSRQDNVQFHERVRVFRLPDARIYDFGYQLEIIEHWGKQYQDVHARVAALTGQGLSPAMLRRFNNLKAFAQHAGEIVPGIADRLLPKDFEEFVAHGFADKASNP